MFRWAYGAKLGAFWNYSCRAAASPCHAAARWDLGYSSGHAAPHSKTFSSNRILVSRKDHDSNTCRWPKCPGFVAPSLDFHRVSRALHLPPYAPARIDISQAPTLKRWPRFQGLVDDFRGIAPTLEGCGMCLTHLINVQVVPAGLLHMRIPTRSDRSCQAREKFHEWSRCPLQMNHDSTSGQLVQIVGPPPHHVLPLL